MIKVRIFPRFGRIRGANLGKCQKNVKIIGFFIKNVQKEGFCPSGAKLEQLPLTSLEK